MLYVFRQEEPLLDSCPWGLQLPGMPTYFACDKGLDHYGWCFYQDPSDEFYLRWLPNDDD